MGRINIMSSKVNLLVHPRRARIALAKDTDSLDEIAAAGCSSGTLHASILDVYIRFSGSVEFQKLLENFLLIKNDECGNESTECNEDCVRNVRG